MRDDANRGADAIADGEAPSWVCPAQLGKNNDGSSAALPLSA